MSWNVDTAQSKFIQSCYLGFLRGVSVDMMIYPIEVVKTRQQCSKESEKSFIIAKKLFQEEGFKGFYKGLPHYLLRNFKQFWSWPMAIEIPKFLNSYKIQKIYQYPLTAISIATVDTLLAPLDAAKTSLILNRKRRFSLIDAYKDGWHGSGTYFTKRSVTITTFLIAQEYLRESNRKSSNYLNLSELIKTGIQVALPVSIVAAPFDIINTLKQANLKYSDLFSRSNISKIYRGWPLNAVSLVIHSIASVALMEKLSERK